MNAIFKTLPLELAKHIVTYDRRFYVKNGQLLEMPQFAKDDPRYQMLETIPYKYATGHSTEVELYVTFDIDIMSYISLILDYSQGTDGTYRCDLIRRTAHKYIYEEQNELLERTILQ